MNRSFSKYQAIKKGKINVLFSHDFTLTELLVVIAILATLVSLLQPSLIRAMETADTIKCLRHQSAISIAMNLYSSNNDNYIVQAGGDFVHNVPGGKLLASGKTRLYSWDTKLAPYMGRDEMTVYKIQDGTQPLNDVLRCPSDPILNQTGWERRSYSLIGRKGIHITDPEDWGPGTQMGVYALHEISAPSTTLLMSEWSHALNLVDNTSKVLCENARVQTKLLLKKGYASGLHGILTFNYLMVDGSAKTLFQDETVSASGNGMWSVTPWD